MAQENLKTDDIHIRLTKKGTRVILEFENDDVIFDTLEHFGSNRLEFTFFKA